ncbi:cation:proton antiporter [Blastomonas aquatica]|uniref:Kef-type K+ transport system n=1 Tax=Blastomonas aquatica TaxID=1510276 RepID=A0ABQ1JLG1_9SPHN|nr:cation:proton antiporter [Blastomonas aquatica]GGB72039.1 Kef-type K+ transport system [Blastomonas aquatica]
MTPSELSAYFFVQVALIIATCRLIGYAVRRWLGQPQVVGEMMAGVVLGPSLFGYFLPDLQSALFPAETRNVLFVCAQLGVGLYMFIVGLGFRSDHFRAQMGSAAAVSFTGMAVPFLVAVVLAPMLQRVPGLFASDVNQFQATLFLGACIAITAFPMLARIIHERGLTNTRLGSLTLSAGAIDDAAAWTVLAIVLASFGDGPGVAIKAIAGGAAFAAFMLIYGRRLLAPLGRIAERDGKVTHTMLAVVLVLFMLAAFAMDFIGIHAVLGGFVLGICMPRGVLATDVQRQLEPIVMVLLIPMFFAYSGLNTQLTVVNNAELLAIAMGILAASILAKGVACYVAARLTGQDVSTAMAIGALMNARGMMELIIINIGLQRGIIGPALFSMLVIMAIVTTFMASPLFDLVYGRKHKHEPVTDDVVTNGPSAVP